MILNDEYFELIDRLTGRSDLAARLPNWGTPAADLTEGERAALHQAAGVRMDCYMVDGTTMALRPARKITITDRGDGGYYVIQHLTVEDEIAAAISARERAYAEEWRKAWQAEGDGE